MGIMDDLYKINLDDTVEQFSWENVKLNLNDITPGINLLFDRK